MFDVTEYIGLDIEKSGHGHKDEDIDVYYDGKNIPFEDAHFDSIFSSEVFEHVFNLEEVIPELHRVLKPEGYLLCTTPFVWDEHEAPYDFARYTSFGMKYLLEKNGFEIILCQKTTHYVETIFQMICVYINKVVFPKNSVSKVLLTPIFITPFTIIGIILSRLLPDNGGFYHNNVIVAKKSDKVS